MQSWNATFFLFFLLFVVGRGVISGRVRALNLTVPLGSGRVGSDNLGYGPGSGFSFKPVQTSSLKSQWTFNNYLLTFVVGWIRLCSKGWARLRWYIKFVVFPVVRRGRRSCIICRRHWSDYGQTYNIQKTAILASWLFLFYLQFPRSLRHSFSAYKKESSRPARDNDMAQPNWYCYMIGC